MFWRTANHSFAIGLDLDVGVRMLQLGMTAGRELFVQAMALDPQLDLSCRSLLSLRERSAGLMRLLRHGRFVGRRVVMAAPRDVVQHKSIRLPPMDTTELAGAVNFEAKTLFDATPDSHVIDFVPMGQVRQAGEAKQEVLIAVARREPLDQLVESLHLAGVTLDAIDFEPCLLYRTVARFVRRKDDEQEVHVLLDVGLDATTVLIGRGRELCLYRPIETGMRAMWQEVARKLGIEYADAQTLVTRLGSTPDTGSDTMDDVKMAVFDASRPIVDDLAREVALCLRYATVTFRGLRPVRVRLTGLGTDDFVVCEVLRRSLPISVEPSKPILNADLSRLRSGDRSGNLSAWTRAFGLALRSAPGGLADKLGVARSAQPVSVDSLTHAGVPAEIALDPAPTDTTKQASCSEKANPSSDSEVLLA